MDEKKKAVVLLSGGLDSTTTLAVALREGYAAYAMSFRYGQRHSVELQSAERVAHRMAVEKHLIVDIDLRSIGGSALTDEIEVPKQRSGEQMAASIPVTYVPARNTIFLSLALAWAEVIGAEDIFIGVNALDYCVPGTTDVMTETGIKKIQDLVVGERVLSYGNDGMNWKRIVHHASSPFQDKLLRIHCSGNIFECTPNHHMLRVDYEKRFRLLSNKRIAHVQAHELRVGDYLLLPAQEIDTSHEVSEYFDFAPYIPLVQWKEEKLEIKAGKVGRVTGIRNYLPLQCKLSDVLALIAWYVTEGSMTNSNGLYISQNNGENIRRIISAVESIGLKAHIETKSNGDKAVFCSHPVIAAWFKSFGRRAQNKRLPDWCLRLPNRYLHLLFETLIRGDGCWQRQAKMNGKLYNHFYCEFYSSSEILLKQVSYIGTRLGYRASVLKTKRSTKCVRFTKPGSRLINGASLIRVTAIEQLTNEAVLYDITVEDNHTFIGGSFGFIIAGQSGYPDCRPEYIEAFERMANLATKAGVEGRMRLKIHTPLVAMTKAEIIKTGLKLGVDYSLTHSCYDPTDDMACGSCDSCRLRLKGFAEAGTGDPLRYAGSGFQSK
jgi:queuosine biosynthesis protein QueC